jgi:hypothetical protein
MPAELSSAWWPDRIDCAPSKTAQVRLSGFTERIHPPKRRSRNAQCVLRSGLTFL